jgi:hypothetical protein
MRDFVRKRIGAPLTIIISPWRSSKTRLDMRLFLICCRNPDPAGRDTQPESWLTDHLNRVNNV